MKFYKIIMVVAIILISIVNAHSATYIVDAGGQYDYTSISACADAAQAGDTCSVRNGSYAGFTAPRSGAPGEWVTFRAEPGHSPTVTSSISLSGQSYIHVEGFSISGSVSSSDTSTDDGAAGSSRGGGGGGGGCLIAASTSFAQSGRRGSYLKIIRNTVRGTMAMDADHVLISDNTFNNMLNDAIRQFGQYFVVRNNVMVHEVDSDNIHMELWQSWCELGRATPPSYLLLENNTFVDVSGSNVHFSLMNDTNACFNAPTNHIYRYNKLHNIGANGIYVDTSGYDGQGKIVIYNNTFSKMFRGSASWNEYTCDMRAAINSSGINNIMTDSTILSGVIGFNWGSGGTQSYNLYYSSAGTMTFSGLASGEPGAIKNKNPLLHDPDNLDFSLQSGSPAIDAGGPLTEARNSGSSSANLTVAKAEFFQDGSWIDGVEADWISIGTVTNAVQISSIEYSTNTITLASALSWSEGDRVWLYKKSDGVQVLYGTAPDIGAVEYGSDF